MKYLKYIVIFVLFQSIFSCNKIGAGSLYGWNVVAFPVSSSQFDIAIKRLYKEYPNHVIPLKWKKYGDDWVKNSYLDQKIYIFYFDKKPEEMYYVSLVDPGYTDHPEYVRFSIRGVEIGDGNWKWNKECTDEEKVRIEKRFKDEIISRLEKYTNSKSYVEK